jgi:hypothetical protein
MKKALIVILLFCLLGAARAETITPIAIIQGSSSGQIFGPPACDGNAYQLTWDPFTGHVVKTYLFVASQAPAIDGWLYTDTGQIIGEVHRITAVHPNGTLRYWEAERDFGKDSVYVSGGIWFLALCYGGNAPGVTIEPYAIIYTRQTP